MPSPERPISLSRARHTLWTLLFATLVCAGMALVRFVWAGNLRFSGLLGNMLLAWIPLILAILIRRVPAPGAQRVVDACFAPRPAAPYSEIKPRIDNAMRSKTPFRRRSWFWGALILWILFFPNTFYIVTDLVHLKKFGTDGVARWFDMLMTIAFATGGVFLGCLSLYLMHLFVRQRLGWRVGWLFAGGMLALGSFGIYLGRFLRLNSWDVVARPLKLVGDISALIQPTSAKEVIGFSITFFFFSLATYLFVVSIARLHETEVAGEVTDPIDEASRKRTN